MRIQLTKEFDGQPAGFLGEFPDDRAQEAVGSGSAVPAARVRFTRDHAIGPRRFASRQEYDLPQTDAAKAVGDGAAEYSDPAEAERFKAGEAKAEPAAPEPAPDARRTRTPKVEG